MSLETTTFENVTALVRGLHGPIKNVCRPASSVGSVVVIGDDDDNDGRHSPPSTAPAPTDKYNSHKDHHRFFPNFLHHQFMTTTPLHNRQHRHSNPSLNIPSLVVTEPPLAATSTADQPHHQQRRFSTLYLGLRRFSTSSLVYMLCVNCDADFVVCVLNSLLSLEYSPSI